MNPQMKRGFLEACVLATLAQGESYGYRIVKNVPDSLGLTESTLYPVLKRLEGSGLIAARSAEHNGRLRRYYRLTDAGVAQMRAFVDEQDEVREIYRFVEGALADVGTGTGLSPAADTADATGAAGVTGATGVLEVCHE